MWQDYVIAAVIVVFSLTTLPLIVKRVKMPLWTAVPMVLGSITLALVYTTLGLWFSLGVEIACAILWSTILFISIKGIERHEHAWEVMSWKQGKRVFPTREGTVYGGDLTMAKIRCEGCGEWEDLEWEGKYSREELGWA